MACYCFQITERQSRTRRRWLSVLSTSSALRAAAAEAAPSPGDAVAGVGLDETLASDDLRSSASSSTWHSCFACVSDTLVITGKPVADLGVAYAPERIG
jgi:hypothetical protein